MDHHEMPCCPVCGEECNDLYIGSGQEILGCDRCVHTECAYERLAEDEYGARIDYYYDQAMDRKYSNY